MKNRLIRLLSLILAIISAFALCQSCGKTKKDESRKEDKTENKTEASEDDIPPLPNHTLFTEGETVAVIFLPEGYMESSFDDNSKFSYFGSDGPIERLTLSYINAENVKMDEKLCNSIDGAEKLSKGKALVKKTKNGNESVIYYAVEGDSLALCAYIKSEEGLLLCLDFTEEKKNLENCLASVDHVLFPKLTGEYTTDFSFHMGNNYEYVDSSYKKASIDRTKKYTVTLPDNYFVTPESILYRIEKQYDGSLVIDYVCTNIIENSASVRLGKNTSLIDLFSKNDSFPNLEGKVPSLNYTKEKDGRTYAYSSVLKGGEFGMYRLFFVRLSSGHVICIPSDVFEDQRTEHMEKIVNSIR